MGAGFEGGEGLREIALRGPSRLPGVDGVLERPQIAGQPLALGGDRPRDVGDPIRDRATRVPDRRGEDVRGGGSRARLPGGRRKRLAEFSRC